MAVTCKHLFWLRKLDFPLMLQVKLAVVDRINPQSNMFALLKLNWSYQFSQGANFL